MRKGIDLMVKNDWLDLMKHRGEDCAYCGKQILHTIVINGTNGKAYCSRDCKFDDKGD